MISAFLFTMATAIQPVDFDLMIRYATGYTASGMDFMGYGCYCGLSPSKVGTVGGWMDVAQSAERTCDQLLYEDPTGDDIPPLDGVDECCRLHDQCFCEYKELCPGSPGFEVDYSWKRNRGSIQCQRGWGFITSTECRMKLCECDARAAECFARHQAEMKPELNNPAPEQCMPADRRLEAKEVSDDGDLDEAQAAVAEIDWVAGFSDASARTLTAEAGTTLTFNWIGDGHNVYALTSSAEKCNIDSATQVGSGSTGPVSFTIPSDAKAGDQFNFACKFEGHCSAGQHLTVTVGARDGDVEVISAKVMDLLRRLNPQGLLKRLLK